MAVPGGPGSSEAANKMVAMGDTVDWIEPGGECEADEDNTGKTITAALDDAVNATFVEVSDSGPFELGDTIKIDDEMMYVKSIDVPVDSGADLTSTIDDQLTTTLIPVTDSTLFTVGDIIRIDEELMDVTAIPDAVTLTVTRGHDGTTVASHKKGTMIFIVTLDTLLVDRGVGDSGVDAHDSGSAIYKLSWTCATDLLTVSGKYSNPTDLMIQFTAESALFTKISSGGPEEKGDIASAQLEVWVEIDGTEVRITESNSDGSVVFNNREFGIKTLNLPERSLIELYLSTRSANAFNWVQLNAGELDTDGDGELIIVVYGKVTTNKPNTEATAGVGKRVLIVEPTKMATGSSR
jgi:hypothetical protein